MRKLCIQVLAERGERNEGTRARRPDKRVEKEVKVVVRRVEKREGGKEWESRTLNSKLMASAVTYCCRL